MTSSHDNFAEDLSFPWGGYWVGSAGRLIQGDGVRFDRDDPTCYLVHEVNVRGDGKVDLLVTDRQAHIADLITDVFHRPQGEQDHNPNFRTMDQAALVWIRL